MTIKEAVLAAISPYAVADAAIEKALVDNDLDGAAIYSKADAGDVNAVAYDALSLLLSVESISEGSYSIKFKTAELQNRLVTIAHQSSNPTHAAANPFARPTVKGKRPW